MKQNSLIKADDELFGNQFLISLKDGTLLKGQRPKIYFGCWGIIVDEGYDLYEEDDGFFRYLTTLNQPQLDELKICLSRLLKSIESYKPYKFRFIDKIPKLKAKLCNINLDILGTRYLNLINLNINSINLALHPFWLGAFVKVLELKTRNPYSA